MVLKQQGNDFIVVVEVLIVLSWMYKNNRKIIVVVEIFIVLSWMYYRMCPSWIENFDNCSTNGYLMFLGRPQNSDKVDKRCASEGGEIPICDCTTEYNSVKYEVPLRFQLLLQSMPMHQLMMSCRCFLHHRLMRMVDWRLGGILAVIMSARFISLSRFPGMADCL